MPLSFITNQGFTAYRLNADTGEAVALEWQYDKNPHAFPERCRIHSASNDIRVLHLQALVGIDPGLSSFVGRSRSILENSNDQANMSEFRQGCMDVSDAIERQCYQPGDIGTVGREIRLREDEGTPPSINPGELHSFPFKSPFVVMEPHNFMMVYPFVKVGKRNGRNTMSPEPRANIIFGCKDQCSTTVILNQRALRSSLGWIGVSGSSRTQEAAAEAVGLMSTFPNPNNMHAMLEILSDTPSLVREVIRHKGSRRRNVAC